MSANLKLVPLGIACLAAGWLIAGVGSSATRITFLDVGQGDCAVIQVGRQAVLVDAGPSESAAKWQILPALRRLGVTDLAAVFLTHPDKDHVAGVPILARQMPNLKFAIPEGFRDHPEWKGLLDSWKLPPERIAYLPRSGAGSFGELRLQMFSVADAGEDNDGSLFLKVTSGNASAVLSGDATAESEAVAAASGDWTAQLMKAGHHGSKTSSSFSWLEEVKPGAVVVSCGKDNRYGHPHEETLFRVGRQAKVYRTDQSGDLSFILRNGRFELER